MRRLAALAIAAAALLVAAPAPAGASTLQSLRGPWAGTLEGVEPRIEVSLRLTGGKRSTIAFRGGIDCSGTLVYTGRTPRVLRFSERITQSSSTNCGGLGVVRLRLLDDGRLQYRWRAIGADIPPARAVLERVALAG